MKSDSTPQTYSQEEVQQILQLAIAQRSDGEELTRTQLFEIAAELEIPTNAIEAAERAWLERQREQAKRQIFDRERWSALKRKVGKYTIANGFLIALDLVNNARFDWSPYIALSWGLLLSLNAWKTYHIQGEEYEQAFRTWERKYQLKESAQQLWRRFQQVLQSS